MRHLTALPLPLAVVFALPATMAGAATSVAAVPAVDGTAMTAEVVAESPDKVRTDMRARFEVDVVSGQACGGCSVQVGLGGRFTRVGTLADDSTFGAVVTVPTPDEPGYYDATVRLVRPDGSRVEAAAGTIVVHGVVAWHVKAKAQDRSLDAGDRLIVRGTLAGEDVDGSMEPSAFHATVRLQYRKDKRWITVATTDARRQQVVTLRAAVRTSTEYRLFAVGEDAVSNTVPVKVH